MCKRVCGGCQLLDGIITQTSLIRITIHLVTAVRVAGSIRVPEDLSLCITGMRILVNDLFLGFVDRKYKKARSDSYDKGHQSEVLQS